MTSMVDSPTLDASQDPAIDRRTRAFLMELNKDGSPFWELPGDEPRRIVTALQDQTPVALSGIELGAREQRYAAPLKATTEQLRGLPPTMIQTAENDVLRDEGEAYARLLDEAGVDVTNVRYNGAIHDFALLNALRDVPSAEAALRQAAADLAHHLR